MTTSHRAVLVEAADEYRLDRRFVEALAPTRDERRKSTILHAMAGKPPGKTGRTLCRFCECRLSDPCCDQFRRSTVREAERILDEYLEAYCPECKQKMEGHRPVEVMAENDEPRAAVSMEPKASPEPMTFTTETKTRVQPCECLLDEPRKLGAVDREELDRDARDGAVVPGYTGRATDGTDPLGDFEP